MIAVGAALAAAMLVLPGSAHAARGMELALQDDATLVYGGKALSRSAALDRARDLGVTRLRVNLLWAGSMSEAQADARSRPAPIAYQFGLVDQLVDEAAAKGIRVHLSLTGPAPRWANARRAGTRQAWYKPDARAFGDFAGVAARHFQGRVDRYSIWNEPNWKTWLGPLGAAPRIYRAMYTRAYSAIKAADPAAKVLIGETSPFARRGMSTAPLAFLRRVACVTRTYRKARRCAPLRADGYAHHPYDFGHAPNYRYPGADNATLGTLGHLTKALDRLRRVGALRPNGGRKMQVYLTEYGYFASGHRALPVKKRKRYLARAYTMALRNPRVRSQLQYLLLAPPRTSTSSFFNLALLQSNGRPYPQYDTMVRWFRAHRGKVRRPGGPIVLPPARPSPVV